MAATAMAANGLIYKMFTRIPPRGCDVLQIGLMDCGSRYTPHAVMPFQHDKHDSSCGQALNLQDNRQAYHNRPVSHTAPQTGKSISYLSHV